METGAGMNSTPFWLRLSSSTINSIQLIQIKNVFIFVFSATSLVYVSTESWMMRDDKTKSPFYDIIMK